MKRTIYIGVVGLILIFVFNYAYAEERITLSTYYPAPYGEYRKLAIGSSAGGYTAPTSAEIDLVVEGNVGIGTTGPGRKLDVAERMRVRDGAGTAGIWYANGTNDRQFAGVKTHSATGTLQKWGVYNNSAWRFIVEGRGNVGIGTTSPTSAVAPNGQATGNLDVNDVWLRGAGRWASEGGVPSGVIVMWSGTLASIPDGWVLCDGASGTPNLTNRFIYGLTTGAPGTGGSNTHSHGMGNKEVMFGPNAGDVSTVYLGGYRFSSSLYTAASSSTIRVWFDDGTSSDNSLRMYLQTRSDAVTETDSTLPRYYKLAFIMKL